MIASSNDLEFSLDSVWGNLPQTTFGKLEELSYDASLSSELPSTGSIQSPQTAAEGPLLVLPLQEPSVPTNLGSIATYSLVSSLVSPSEVLVPPKAELTSNVLNTDESELTLSSIASGGGANGVGTEVYKIDDGTAETIVGLTNGGDLMWLNQFNVVPGSQTITSIALAWGRVPTRSLTQLLVYEDPNDDGNPNDAQLLRQINTRVANPETNQFKTVTITPTTVSGSFFIAALFSNQQAGQFPAPLDTTTPQSNRSWIASAGSGQFNINNLTANPPLLTEQVGLPGNWLLRADSQAAVPTITLSVSPSSVTEDGTSNLVYTFSRTTSTTSPLTVNFTVGGTARSGFRGRDYSVSGGTLSGSNGTITFAPGSSTATFTVDPRGDTKVEPDETAILTLAPGTGYTVGTPSTATGTILNDDGGGGVPTITLSVSPSSVTEDGTSNLVYTFSRTTPTTSPLTVNFTVGGTATRPGSRGRDYSVSGGTLSGSNGTITFAPGSSTATFTVDPRGDTSVEPDETAILTLAPGTGYTIGTPSTATGTILNDDGAQSEYQIDIIFTDNNLTPSQQAIFTDAANRWAEIVIGDVPDIANVPGIGFVDDLAIEASAPFIDGPGGILGQAGPTFVRSGSRLPVAGIMEFDSADVAALEASGQLDEVILHEMAHVMGFGTIWDDLGLVSGAGGFNPRFLGTGAAAEYNSIFGISESSVPLENTGGAGTRDSHWKESVFDNELMTGFLNSGAANPLSRITAASFGDLGYEVDVSAADPYSPPSLVGDRTSDVVGQLLALDLNPTALSAI